MLLQTKNLGKRFGNFWALREVDFALHAGEVHGLVGENGAGKSTLIKILTGVYRPDAGEILWNGAPVQLLTPGQSRALGINVIHQERNLIPSFNGVENAYLGLPYLKRGGISTDWKRMRRRVMDVMGDLGLHDLDITKPALSLSPSQQTLLEIVRAMMVPCKLLILDEPTASLTDKETEMLFHTIARLKAQGTSILYVTHRMEEIFRLTDRITVLKNGEMRETVQTGAVTVDQIIGMMTEKWTSNAADDPPAFGEALLSADGIATADGRVKDASVSVRAGEILGVFGLGGSGRTEFLECLYGLRRKSAGTIMCNGAPYATPTPLQSLRRGVVLISEDRRGQGLVESLSIKQNIVLSTLDRYARLGVMDGARETAAAQDKIKALDIKASGPAQPVRELSGGNQQKVVFAKALMGNPKVLLCDEPTQAVDVKTRAEIHNLLRDLARKGSAIVFVSSDLKEVLEIADNIQVMREGKTEKRIKNEQLTADQILACCYGASDAGPHNTADACEEAAI